MNFILVFFLLILGLSYVELMLLVKFSANFGFLATFLICFLTAVIGGYLAKKEGLSVITELQQKISRGEDPTRPILGGLLLLFSGVFLLVPGFVTDGFGFLCLLKPFREGVASFLFRHLKPNKAVNMNIFHSSPGAEHATKFYRYTSYTGPDGSTSKNETIIIDESEKILSDSKSSHDVIDVEFSEGSNKKDS